MSNPRDEIDAWLDDNVEPLLPPPGTFERISKRARRRKRRQVILSAAGAVVVIAAVAIVPQVASTLLRHSSGPSRPVAEAGPSPTTRPSSSPAKSNRTPASPTATPTPSVAGPAQWATPTGQAALGDFQPTSITLIGPSVGAVIGQARCAAGAAGLCTSLAATTDEGGSWYGGLTAPPAPAPSGADGVSQLRFLTTQYGWAYGPTLYATTDGGQRWISETIPNGLRAVDLETAGNHAFAVFASCGGTGSSYAADCTSFSLYTSAEDSTSWQPVQVPKGYGTMTGSPAGQTASASLVLASGPIGTPDAGTGYLLTPSGELLSGPLAGGPWAAVGQIPAACQVGAAQSGGQPAGVQLASGSAASGPQLLLSCNVAASQGSGMQVEFFSSANGKSWTPRGAVPGAGTARSLGAAAGDLAVLATSTGIDYSVDGGTAWQPSTFTTATSAVSKAPAGGFSYVGMTSAEQGVAMPADASLGEVFITMNGGQTWTASSISGT